MVLQVGKGPVVNAKRGPYLCAVHCCGTGLPPCFLAAKSETSLMDEGAPPCPGYAAEARGAPRLVECWRAVGLDRFPGRGIRTGFRREHGYDDGHLVRNPNRNRLRARVGLRSRLRGRGELETRNLKLETLRFGGCLPALRVVICELQVASFPVPANAHPRATGSRGAFRNPHPQSRQNFFGL